MNISITHRSATQISVVPGTYYYSAKESSFAAIMDGYFVYGWLAANIDFGSIRREAITEGEEISSLSPLARILTESDFEVITRERFVELFDQAVAYMKEVKL